MKDLKFDVSKMKKVASDKHTTTFQHPKGHQIVVAHASLSPKMRAQLHELPTHLADGGDVDADTAPAAADAAPKPQAPVTINIGSGQIPPSALNPNPGSQAGLPGQIQAMSPVQQMATKGGDLPYGVTPEKVAEAAQPPQVSSPVGGAAPPSPEPPAPQQQDPFGTQAFDRSYTAGLRATEQGIQDEAKASGAEGEQQAARLQSTVEREQAAAKGFQQHWNDLETERQAFVKDLQNSHIDPQHYVGDMSTGKKVATAIGLILGGIGGAITHQENPAMKFLSSQIDRDIEAQRVNLGKKENLLSANMRQFGNLRDATDMTRVMQMDILANQLKMEAAKATTPLARARALQAAGKLEMDAAPIMSQIAMRRTLLTSMQNGQSDPAKVVNMIVPEHQRAEANKELTAAQNMAQMRDNALNAYDQVSNMMLRGAFSPSQKNALIQPILAQMVKDSEGRITPQDTKMIEAFFPSATDFSAETQALKRQQLTKFLTEKMHFPILQTYGINPGLSGRYNNQGQARIQESAPVVAH